MSSPDDIALGTGALPRTGLTLGGFVHSAGLMSVSAAANVVRGLVTAKVLAVTLGPSPLGIFSQLLSFSALLMTVVPLGLTTGVSKLVAESRESEAEVNRIVGTSAALAVASGLVAAAIASPFAIGLSELLTGSSRYALFVVVLLATLPLSNVAGVLSYVLQGMAELGKLTWANVVVAAGTLMVTVPAAYEFGLPGVVGALFASSLLSAAALIVAVQRAYSARGYRLRGLKFSWTRASTLLSYGNIMLIGGIAMLGSVLVVRTLAIRELGEFQNGLYQVAYALSSQYMAVFMAWMAGYAFPRIATLRDAREIGAQLNFGLDANLYLVVPLFVVIVALREPLISLLFSPAFLSAAPLIPPQVFGDYLRVLGWSFGVSLFARGRTRAHLLAVVAQAVAWVAITFVLLRPLGLAAVVLGYAVSCVLWPALMYPMARHWFGVRLSRQGAFLSTLGLLLLSGAAFLPTFAGTALALVMPAALLYKQRHALIRRFAA